MLAVGAAAGEAPLLRPSDVPLGAEMREQLEEDPYAMRWRVAGMDGAAVFESQAWGRPLALDLFPDAQVVARVQRARTLPSGSRFLAGALEGGGHFTLLRSAGGILRGEFHSARGVFTMRSHGPGRVLVAQQDVSALPGCGLDGAMREALPAGLAPKGLATARRPRPRPPQSLPTATDDEADPNVVAVLVLYTQRVEDHEGGPDEVIVTLENEIAKMNQVLENSGLAGRRVRGVFEKVDYEQAVDLSIDRKNLKYTEEDHGRFNREVDHSALDEVFPLIEEHQADLVHLFVRDPGGSCGTAGIYSRSKERGVQRDCENSENVDLCVYSERRKRWRHAIFAVTAVKCAPRGYVFPHELGHNLGLLHDRGVIFLNQKNFLIN